MENKSFGQLIGDVRYRVIYASECGEVGDIGVTDVTDKSAETVSGCAFVCIKGLNSDGHAYAGEAVKRGARLIVCEEGEGERVCSDIRGIAASSGDAREVDVSGGDGGETASTVGTLAVIEVVDTRSVLSVLCARYYGLDRRCPRLICVTGTNGKTTVANLICGALKYCGRSAAVLGTLGGSFDGETYDNGGMTTPDPKRLCELLARFADGGAEFVVMEASSHALALRKLDGLKPEMAIFTNLTPEHLDIHGSMEGYAEAKSRLFRMCATGIIWAEDPHAEKMRSALAEGAMARLCSSSDGDADYRAVGIRSLGDGGVRYGVIRGNFRGNGQSRDGHRVERAEIFSSTPGSFSVPNTLLAFAALCELGIDGGLSAEAISAQPGVKGRMERIELPSEADYSVYVDFAHTPDALAKLISSVRGFIQPERRLVVLFGCGGDRDRSKRSLMGAIASRLADFVIITSDNCRGERAEDIIDEILCGIDVQRPHTVIVDRRKAIEYAVSTAGKGDVILLCGKGHEEYELRGGERLPFNEREIVLEVAKKRIADGKR